MVIRTGKRTAIRKAPVCVLRVLEGLAYRLLSFSGMEAEDPDVEISQVYFYLHMHTVDAI